MKKIFVTVLALVLVCCLFVGCAKLISTDYTTVEAIVVDEYHRSAYVAPMRVGKVTTFRTVPAVYWIIVEYDGIEYTISGHDTWEQYKHMIGCAVPATMKINTYDDGTVKHYITAIEGETHYG